jgi:alcohol dehydrogenase
MFERELTLRFTIGDPTADGAHLLDLVAEGRLDPTSIITHAPEAYELFDTREATKVVLAP